MSEKSLKELQEEVKKAKLEKELKKLKPEAKSKAKKTTKTVKKEENKEMEDLKKLSAIKQKVIAESDKKLKKQTGFFKRTGTKIKAAATLAGLNKAMNEKRKILKQKEQIKRLRLQGEIEAEKAKLRKLREQSRPKQINFEDLTKPIQPIKLEDLY